MTTLGSVEDAQRIATALVERQLAACVQVIGHFTSTYRWQGRIEISQEWMCVIKTRLDCYNALEQAIVELHPYETPEIVALPIVAGSAKYLAWIDQAVASSGDRDQTCA
jgi:periplasmic divalent cation tolerance protein